MVKLFCCTAFFLQLPLCFFAQVIPQATDCDLLKIENEIIDLEEKTYKIYMSIVEDFPFIKKDSFLAQEMPMSVWERYDEKKPSSYIAIPCKRKLYPTLHLNALCDVRNKAAQDLVEAEYNEKQIRQRLNNKPKQPPISNLPSLSPNTFPEFDIPSQEIFFESKRIFGPDKKIKYTYSVFDPSSDKIGVTFFWRDGKGEPYKTFGKVAQSLAKQSLEPLMMVNAGIFSVDYNPLGLFYEKGKKTNGFNNKQGEGNFYLKPSGVFVIYKNGQADVMDNNTFINSMADTMLINYATQSGPMLVINGKIHPAFKKDSPNKHIRNGVGILPDGRVLMLISERPVNFYEFALIFKDGFNCKNALYLDGTISKMYLNESPARYLGGDFAGIIVIHQKKKN